MWTRSCAAIGLSCGDPSFFASSTLIYIYLYHIMHILLKEHFFVSLFWLLGRRSTFMWWTFLHWRTSEAAPRKPPPWPARTWTEHRWTDLSRCKHQDCCWCCLSRWHPLSKQRDLSSPSGYFLFPKDRWRGGGLGLIIIMPSEANNASEFGLWINLI